MKRHSMNYVSNAIMDIRKGVKEVEDSSRRDTLVGFTDQVKKVINELEVMLEVVSLIENQTELELNI